MASEHVGPRSLNKLLEAVISLGSELDLDQGLRRIVEVGVDLTGARYGALGVLDEHRSGLANFVTVGMDDDLRARVGPLPKGLGLLGALIDDARPLRVPDVNDHPARTGFPPGHPLMRSFLGVPIRIRDEVFGNLYLTDKQDGEVFTDVDEELMLGLAAAAGVVIDNARLFDRLRRREAALSAIQQVAASVLEGADPDQILRFVVERARVLARADVATLALPAPDQESLLIKVADGPLGAPMAGIRFPRRGSVSGEVLTRGESVVFADLSQDPRRAQPQVRGGQVGPAMFVILTVGGRPFGTLFIGRATGASPFGRADVEMVNSFAAQAGVVLDTAAKREQLGRLSVLEEQERIARDLHDTVIQQVFAVGLSLNAAAKMTGRGPAHERIEAAIDELDAIIRQLRTVIFDVGSRGTRRSAGLRANLLEQAREISRVLGFDPSVSFLGPVDSLVTDELARAASMTVHEALSNVARHAQATQVEVSVAVTEKVLTVRIIDDGVGFPPGGVGREGNGLGNMRARAEEIGGSFEMRAGLDGTGTSLEWMVPLS